MSRVYTNTDNGFAFSKPRETNGYRSEDNNFAYTKKAHGGPVKSHSKKRAGGGVVTAPAAPTPMASGRTSSNMPF